MWSAGSRTRPRIGRGDVWAALLACQKAVLGGSGAITLLEGVPGVGRSTFLRLVGHQAVAQGFRVAIVGAVLTEDPPPLQLIRAALDQLGTAKKGTSRPPRGPVTPSVVFLPALDGTRPRYGSGDARVALRDDPRSESASDRFGLIESIADSFLQASEDGPLLVGLDDLHWADEASLTFLGQILPRLLDHRIWFLATAIPPTTSPLVDPLSHLRTASGIDRILLRPLSEPEIPEFSRWLVPHRRLEPAEVGRLYAESEGVPARLIALLAPATVLGRMPPGKAPPTPPASATIGEFSPEAQRVLALATVTGMEVASDLLAAASGLTEERTVEHLERFIDRGIVREVGDGRFAFQSEEIRVRLSAEIGTRRLELLHRKIAEALERSGSVDSATVYALARHTYLGGMDQAALRYNQQAAALAASSFEPRLALFYLRHALEVLPASGPDDPSVELQLRTSIAVQQVQLGDTDDAMETLNEIQGAERLWAAATANDRALISLYRARVLADQGRWDEAERSLTEIPWTYTHEGPIPLRRAAMGLRGEILFYRGDYREAVEADEAALKLAQEEGQPREIAAESIRRATALTMFPDRAAEAVEEFRKAIAELVRVGDYSEAAFGALCLGAQLSSQGQVDEARAELVRSIELAERAHDLRRSSWARLNLADLELDVSRVDQAAAQIRAARESFEQVEDDLGQARAALTEGRIALSRGDLDLAQQDFDLARSIFSSRHLAVNEMEVDLRRSELDIARHDETRARERLDRLGEVDLPRLRPDLVGDWERLRRQLGPAEPAAG